MIENQSEPQGQLYRPFNPSIAQKQRDYKEKFMRAMHHAGLNFREEVISDGAIHRFSTGKKGHKDGWYVFYGMAGAFGDWSQDIHEKWSLENSEASVLDKEQLFEQIAKVKKAAEEERIQKYEEAAKLALEKWNSFSEAGSSPYLSNKKIGPFGVKFNNDFLVIPVKGIEGKLWSLQGISPDGTKRFLTGGRKKGCSHTIGNLEDGKPIIVTEGYATGASIHMATQ